MNKVIYKFDDLISRTNAQEHLRHVDLSYLTSNPQFLRDWVIDELNNVPSYDPRWDYQYCGNCGGLKDYCASIEHCCSGCTHSLI